MIESKPTPSGVATALIAALDMWQEMWPQVGGTMTIWWESLARGRRYMR